MTRLISIFAAVILLNITACAKSSINYAYRANNLPEEITEEITIRSENIAKAVKELPYIENATATIIGDRALVSIDLNADYSDNDIIAAKLEVRDTALQSDKSLSGATVTITPHMIDKATDFAGEQENKTHMISDELEEITVPAAPTL